MPIDLSKAKPKTAEEAIDFMFSSLTPHERGILREQFGGLSGKLFTFGQALIEQWGLERDDSPLYQDVLKRFQLGNSDDVCALLLNAVDAKVQHNEFFLLEDRAQILRGFWHQQKLDPAVRHRKLVQEGQQFFQQQVALADGKARPRLS